MLFSAFSVVKRVKISSGKNGFVFDYAGIYVAIDEDEQERPLDRGEQAGQQEDEEEDVTHGASFAGLTPGKAGRAMCHIGACLIVQIVTAA